MYTCAYILPGDGGPGGRKDRNMICSRSSPSWRLHLLAFYILFVRAHIHAHMAVREESQLLHLFLSYSFVYIGISISKER